MKRSLILAVACSVWPVVGLLSLRADEEPADTNSGSDSSSVVVAFQDQPATPEEEGTRSPRRAQRGRLPNYYGQVGVSEEQREMVYAIQAKYREEITKLEMQLRDVQAKRDGEIESVLTDEQKAQVLKLREEARLRRRQMLEQRRAAEAARQPAAEG